MTMPNWVENQIVINASSDVLDEIQNKVRTTFTNDDGSVEDRHLIAQSLVPMPEEIALLDGTDDNVRRFKDLEGNVIKLDQMKAMSFYSMNDEELLGEGYTMEKLTEQELEELREKYGASDWYAWNVRNYGTKWGDVETQLIRRDKESLEYAFETAWSPAPQMIEKIGDKFDIKNISYKYFSIENGDKGGFTFDSNGRVVESHWEVLDESYYTMGDDVEPVGSTNAQAQEKAQEIFG